MSLSINNTAAKTYIETKKASLQDKLEAMAHQGDNPGNPVADGGVVSAHPRPNDLEWYAGNTPAKPGKPTA